MDPAAHEIRMHEVVRYPKLNKAQTNFGAYRNPFTIAAGGDRYISLESGINAMAVSSVSGVRPAILLSSAPWKAGTASTPWHDVFDVSRGHVRYFGDHKSNSRKPLGKTQGNSWLLEQFPAHLGSTRSERVKAVPLLLFRAVSRDGASKGYREFCGLGVLEAAERVVQWDPKLQLSYTNYVFDVAILELAREEELLDWRWINDRRLHAPANPAATARAPESWRRWIDQGNAALPALRRRVARSRVLKRSEQQPPPASPEASVLAHVYKAFAKDKHAFESLASRVAGRLLAAGGGTYFPGWITKAGGDQGIDFVSRVDLGSGPAQVRLVVLGQAKCVDPGSSISAGDLARVVARLRRGWIGAFVTTGSFTDFAQKELQDDEYPLMLVDGLRLAEQVRLIAAESFGGDVSLLLTTTLAQHPAAIELRRPEEILNIDGVVS